MIRRRVRPEPRAVILEERARHREIRIERQHRGRIELHVPGLNLAGPPIEVRVPMMFFVPPGGAWRKRPVRRYVRAIRTERPEIVIGRMVLLNQDHHVFHSAFGSRGHLVLPAKRSLATRLPSPGAARSAERLHTTPPRL